ncbi:MAG: type II 3-dehydroquinate dehydratase [Syntrophomonadaceae bacterium]|nr:type II 3-dehydroquinate dehydratase [Syntrophomonadaceae bacterium]
MTGILFINGPNLNMLGVREKEFYGSRTLEDINAELSELAARQGIAVEFFQSNHEGELVDRIQQAYQKVGCIVINPGAFTHYSLAVYDALRTVRIPVIEVHLSNIYARESFRSHSLFSPLAVGGIFGLGPIGYKLAFYAACELLSGNSKEAGE